MVISPVVLLMMKSPWAPTRISYVISPFDPSSASTAVSWNWKSQHKFSGDSTFHHHVIFFPPNKRSLLSNTHTVSKESSLVIYTLVFLNLGYCVQIMKQSHQKRFFCCCSCESDKRLWILKAIFILTCCCCCCWVASVVSDSVWPHRRQPTRLPHPWDSLGKNTGVGCSTNNTGVGYFNLLNQKRKRTLTANLMPL